MRKWTKVAAALAGGAAVTAAGAYYAYREAFAADPKRQFSMEDIPASPGFDDYREGTLRSIRRAAAIPFTWVYAQSHDGLRLAGRYYEGRPGAPLMLFFHGYRSSAIRDGSGALPYCMERGWHVLTVDQRAHGESEGRTITFGVEERQDCLTWLRVMNERLGAETPAYLWGLSMGASTVLMASELELPPNVRGIVADCGYSTPKDILMDTARRRGLPDWPTWPLLRLGGRLFGGFDPAAGSAVEALKRARVPVLLIHGEADGLVPCAMVHELAAACAAPVTVLTVPGADHGVSWCVAPQRYHDTLERFLAETI